MKKPVCIILVFAIFAALSLAGCSAAESGGTPTVAYNRPASYVLWAEAFEWGPSYTGIIVTFDGNIDPANLDEDTFSVKASGTKRTVLSVYLSDASGNAVTGESNTVTIKMRTGYSPSMLACVESSSAFTTDPETNHSVWLEGGYTVQLQEGKSITVGGVEYNSLNISSDGYAGRICPDVSCVTKGAWQNETGSLSYALFEPEEIKTDSGKNALIVWCHGSGEGGTDIEVALLGAEVTNLFSDEIQQYFREDGLAGAYVLAVQTPTNWMASDQTAGVKAIIDECVSASGDVDENRIYIGGCSAGGYMTLRMAAAYPDFFAAAYPVCAALPEMTDDSIRQLRDVPMWFTHSYDDPTVVPENSVMPLYKRLVDAGAENLVLSMFESVVGRDAEITYYGHWSWIYTLQNRCTLTVDNEAVKNAGTDAELAAAMQVSTVETGTTLFQWLSEQSLTDRLGG